MSETSKEAAVAGSPARTGSVHGFNSEFLAKLWEDQARAIRSNAVRFLNPRGQVRAEAQAMQLDACAEELRKWAVMLDAPNAQGSATPEDKR